MTRGRVGGVITRPITGLCSCSPTIRMRQSRWREGTTYHFVTDGIHAALKLATDAANGKDIRLAGGVATIRQYLQAKLIDQMHIPISPIVLGTGESLFSGIDMVKLGYVVTEHVPTARATHIVLAKHE